MSGVGPAANANGAAAPSAYTNFVNTINENKITLLFLTAVAYIAACYGTETAFLTLSLVVLVPTLGLVVIGFVALQILKSLVDHLFPRGQHRQQGQSWGLSNLMPSWNNYSRPSSHYPSSYASPSSYNGGNDYKGGSPRYESKSSASGAGLSMFHSAAAALNAYPPSAPRYSAAASPSSYSGGYNGGAPGLRGPAGNGDLSSSLGSSNSSRSAGSGVSSAFSSLASSVASGVRSAAGTGVVSASNGSGGNPREAGSGRYTA